MSAMGPVQFILLAVVAALLLAATNRWAKQQKRELENLEPPPSLDSVGTWEDEVLAAQAAAEASSREQAASEAAPLAGAGDPEQGDGADPTEPSR